mgnify:CR=1 FL=1
MIDLYPSFPYLYPMYILIPELGLIQHVSIFTAFISAYTIQHDIKASDLAPLESFRRYCPRKISTWQSFLIFYINVVAYVPFL